MPVIYLRHPRHGNKVAVAESEAQYDERSGWQRYNPNEIEPVVEAVPDFLQSENALVAKRRGRPPKNPEPVA